MLPRAHIISLIVLELVAIAVSLGFLAVLPETVPVHWNIHGQADDFASKWVLLVLMPAVGLAMILLMIVLPLLGPFRRNFEQFRMTYGRLAITLLAGFIGLHVVILLKADGSTLPIGASIAFVLGLMIAVLGNWLGKVRRNFYIGIRTPWTLANNEVWERTHRAGAKLFVAWGLLMALSGLTGSNTVAFIVTIGGAGVVMIWSVLYSLQWYRRLGHVDDVEDRDQRRPPPGMSANHAPKK